MQRAECRSVKTLDKEDRVGRQMDRNLGEAEQANNDTRLGQNNEEGATMSHSLTKALFHESFKAGRQFCDWQSIIIFSCSLF
jgi:hypothetical protein